MESWWHKVSQVMYLRFSQWQLWRLLSFGMWHHCLVNYVLLLRKMATSGSSKTSVNFYQTTWHTITEGSILYWLGAFVHSVHKLHSCIIGGHNCMSIYTVIFFHFILYIIQNWALQFVWHHWWLCSSTAMNGCVESVCGHVLLEAVRPVLDRFTWNLVFCSAINVVN